METGNFSIETTRRITTNHHLGRKHTRADIHKISSIVAIIHPFVIDPDREIVPHMREIFLNIPEMLRALPSDSDETHRTHMKTAIFRRTLNEP